MLYLFHIYEDYQFSTKKYNLQRNFICFLLFCRTPSSYPITKTLVQFSHSALVLDISLMFRQTTIVFPEQFMVLTDQLSQFSQSQTTSMARTVLLCRASPNCSSSRPVEEVGISEIFHKSCSQKMWSHLLSLANFHVQNPVISI